MSDQENTVVTAPIVPVSRLTYDGPKGPLFKALAEARKHFKSLSAVAEADVRGTSKSGKDFSYTFSYAPLDVVLASLDPGLQAAGLAVMQPYDGDNMYTIVACGDSSMTVETPLPNWTTPQELGSLLTYLRRYQLKGLFGVADSEDDDGNAASGNKAQVSRKDPKTAPATGPNISEGVRKEVTDAAKAKELPFPAFAKLAQETCGKPWAEYTELDAKKLLATLVLK